MSVRPAELSSSPHEATETLQPRLKATMSEIGTNGLTWFDTLDETFADVPLDAEGEIETEPWLVGVESMLTLFELYVPSRHLHYFSGAFYDGCKRIREQLQTRLDQEKCTTIQAIFDAEAELPKAQRIATRDIEWHTRALRFFYDVMRHSLDHPNEEMSDSHRIAWDANYSQYFSWIARKLFSFLVRFCPSREQFWSALGPADVVPQRMSDYLDALDARLVIIERLLDTDQKSVL